VRQKPRPIAEDSDVDAVKGHHERQAIARSVRKCVDAGRTEMRMNQRIALRLKFLMKSPAPPGQQKRQSPDINRFVRKQRFIQSSPGKDGNAISLKKPAFLGDERMRTREEVFPDHGQPPSGHTEL